MIIFLLIVLSVILLFPVVVDHTNAPDHDIYYSLSNYDLIFSDDFSNYAFAWSFIIDIFHKSLFDNSVKVPFLTGIIFFFLGLIILSRGLIYNNNILFWLGSLFSYSYLICLSIDKTSLVFLIFAISYVFRPKHNISLINFFLLIIISLIIFYLRGWLLPLLWLIFFADYLNIYRRNISIKLILSSIVVILFVLSFYFNSLFLTLRYLFVFPFIFLDPLPKDNDKFFISGIIYFSLVSFFVRLLLSLFLFKNWKKMGVYGKEPIILILLLPLFVILTSIYFEFNDDIQFGFTSDSVRKLAFFWPLLLAMILNSIQSNQKNLNLLIRKKL